MAPGPRVRLVTGADWPHGDDETRFLAETLRSLGWAAEVVVWSDPAVDWAAAPLALLRSTWDYPARLGDFLAWTRAAARVTALHNPPALVARNVDKRYLLDLAAAGIEVVPTRWVPSLDPAPVRSALREAGWDDLVVKPTVGVDGVGVVRLAASDPLPPAAPRPEGWLIQPFLPSVAGEGERSVVLFDGRVSHAVSKHPPRGVGEFRVQERWGGRTVPATPDPAADAAATRALAAFAGPGAPPPLYARVDLLRHRGAWCVAEIEVVEPSLYFLGEPARVLPLDAALRARLP